MGNKLEILQLLENGSITAEEAERLLDTAEYEELEAFRQEMREQMAAIQNAAEDARCAAADARCAADEAEEHAANAEDFANAAEEYRDDDDDDDDDDWDDGAEEHFFTPSIVFLELENGYQPNKQAKGLAEQKTNTLLFVYENTPDNPFFTELIRGAIDGAKEAHQILLFNIICDSYVTDYFLNALRSDQIDGVIVASTGLEETRNFAKMVASEGRHLVLINDPIGELNVPRIYINNDQSAYQATRHLLECGHPHRPHRRQNHLLSQLPALRGLQQGDDGRRSAALC